MAPSIDSPLTPIACSRFASSRTGKPASMRMRVPPLSTSTAFPALPLPSIQIRTLRAPALRVRRAQLPAPAFAQRNRSPRHHPRRDVEKLREPKLADGLTVHPRKRRHVLRRHLRAKQVRPRADYAPRRQPRADPRLGVIADQRPDFARAGIAHARGRP